MALFHSIWTAALLALFIGIIIWAYSGRRKNAFDQAARMPLDDEDMNTQDHDSAESNHG